MSSFVHREPKEKEMLSQEDHHKILKMLKRGKQVEKALRVLSVHDMDEDLEECDHIVDVLHSMCERSKLGRIAESVVRRFHNKYSQEASPIEYPVKKVIITEARKARPSYKIDKGIEFLKWNMIVKIEENQSLYEKERLLELFGDLLEEQKDYFASSVSEVDPSSLSRKRRSTDLVAEGPTKKSREL